MSQNYAIIRVDFLDEDDVRRYGVSQLGEDIAEQITASCTTQSAEFVGKFGQDEPLDCTRCGCDFHGKARCDSCEHGLCRGEA